MDRGEEAQRRPRPSHPYKSPRRWPSSPPPSVSLLLFLRHRLPQPIPNPQVDDPRSLYPSSADPSVKMKAAVILSFVAAALAGAVEVRDGHCGGDNCARQVTGTRDGLSPIESRKADCSSFQKTTVVPDATTTTDTVTVDAGVPSKFRRDAGLEYRAATEAPTVVPAYASSCQEGTKYASACSCWGITAVTTTAPQPTKTATVTVTGGDYCDDL
ncbi:hypothetical protein TOPH_00783 [Tolypocladium ophioglossoides CBS 100239]|uniref:Uncharacterized protein n=1 Tax=Tolypocladium ophioglossoides (strain CBS 100239) TaxID=1163406 RepID=A0A0L0NJS4_TOLOC|nr:hypothetical protein TOPH_00783 [Tolypocladium ophioglossoides CBS 100239]